MYKLYKENCEIFSDIYWLEDDRIQMLLPRPCLICWACALLAFADGFPPAVLIRETATPETTFPQGMLDRGISRKDDDKNQQIVSLPGQLTLSAQESADNAASAGTESERSHRAVTISQGEFMTTESAVENVTKSTKEEDKVATIDLSVEDATIPIKQESISSAKIDSKESISTATKDAAKSIALLSDNMATNSPTNRPEGKRTPDESLTDRDVLEIRMNLTELLEETIGDESLEEAASRPLVEVTLEQEAEGEAEEEAEEEETEKKEEEEAEQQEVEQKEEVEDESLEEAASRPLVEVTLEQEEDGRTDLPWEPLFLNSSSSLQQEEDLTEEDNEEGTGGRVH
jgi:hypothetical protein